MKKNIKRAVGSLLAASMLASLAACGGSTEETTAVTTAAPIVEEGPVEIKPDMPDDLKFEGGTVRFIGMENQVEGINAEEGQEVRATSQETYDRNRRVEERFGVTLEFTNIQNWNDGISMAIRQDVNSGSAEYDVAFATCWQQVPLIDEGMYIPISDLPWCNLEKPWWNKGYIESVSFNGDNPYVLFGNFCYNQVERTTCTYANITKLEAQHNIVADDLFELVENGEWTLDKFTELVNMGYKDDNGNTKPDECDMFGLIGLNGVNFLAYGCGLSYTDRDEDGFPVLDLNNETAIELTEKLISLYHNNQNVLTRHPSYGSIAATFGSCTTLFSVERLFVAGWGDLREMKDDFVILPIPKYDETIDGYHGVVEKNVQWGCVMVTAAEEDYEMISAVLEQMNYDGYNTIVPLYYENDLKLKYTRGEADRQSAIIDMIVEGARTDYLFVNGISGLDGIFATCVNAGQNTFASYYAQREVLAAAKLKQLIEKYEERIYG